MPVSQLKMPVGVLLSVVRRRGVAFVPLRSLSSGGRWFDRLIPDDDADTKAQKEKEREVVLKKMTRSLFAELRAAPGEKTIATPDLIPALSAVHFPVCAAIPLVEESVGSTSSAAPDPLLALPDVLVGHPATLVTICFQALGQAQLKKWTLPFAEAFSPYSITSGGRPAAAAPAMLNVLYLEGFFFSAFRRVFVSSSRKSQSAAEGSYGAISFQPSEKETDYFCEALGLHNKLMCHVLLVDSEGRVRWRAHAEPAPGETEALHEATRRLLAEGSPLGGRRR